MSDKSPGIIGLKTVKRPEYAEAHTSDEDRSIIPWEVKMFVRKNELDERTHEVCYYVRAANPGKAAVFAHSLWFQWEKKDRDLEFSRFPNTEDLATTECMDEGDWKEAWEGVQRQANHKHVGMKENPSAFVFWPKGWFDSFPD